MASFTREHYSRVFRFAAKVWLYMSKRKSQDPLRQEAEYIMNICEDVIGQQWFRPDRQSRNELMKDE